MDILIADAMRAWERAPLHIRVMAGEYVGPILAALLAIGDEIDKLKEREKHNVL